MPDDPEDATDPAVERRIVSVLFADLVGFTSLSERLDAEDVATIQDAYFAATRETIERYGGVLEKFIGDAAMAVFGAPRARDDDAERAVRAGLALIGAVEQLGARLGLAPGELQLRVGVNSGEVVHATAGPAAGRVTGDTVNTSARLQAATDPGTVLLGEVTALTVAEAIETVAAGSLELKGKAQPVRVWRALGARPQPSREEALGALRAPLLGREAELRRLTQAVARVSARATADRLVIIAPPGVGKSRLLAELGSTTTATTVLRARVRPQATAPYETVAQLLSAATPEALAGALAEAGVPPARAAFIGTEVARLRTPTEGVATAPADLAAERDARFDAWVTALDVLSTGPSLWLVEDVHWAGGDLLAFLDHAARAATRHGRLVVATARPSLLETAPAWSEAGRLDLGPLPPADATALLDALLGAGVLPSTLARAVVERSDGTPLFIEELVRTWVSVGTLVEGAAGGWRLAVEPDEVPMPQTVQAIYAAQLDDLPQDSRAVARRGAVAGRRVPVAAFEPLELARHTSGLDGLRRRAFLTGPHGDPITGDAYAYRHALLRDAGYASLARVERARLHLAMARWLESMAGPRGDVVAEAVAEHYAAAQESRPALADELPERTEIASRAASWYERAAEAALLLSAHQAADRLFGRAAELTIDAPFDLSRRRMRRGEVLAASADLDAGIAEMEAALAAAGDDAVSSARAAHALARAYMQQIRFEEAEALTAGVLARLAGAPAALLAPLHALHAWSVSAQGRSDGVAEEADLAEALMRDVDDPRLGLVVIEHVTAARDEIGMATDAGWTNLEAAARALGQWSQVTSAMRVRAVYRAMDDPEAALPLLVEAREVAESHGLSEAAGWADYSRCEVLWVLGRWDEALAAGDQAIAVAEQYAYERLAFRTFVVILPLAAARGDPVVGDRYRRWWKGAEAHFPPSPSPYGRVLQAAIAGWLAEAAGEAVPEPPAAIVDAIVSMVNPHFLAAVEGVVRAMLDAGRVDLASAAADRVAANALEEDATGLMRASADLIAAWVADARGDVNAAVEAAERAAAEASSIGAPWWVLRALDVTGPAAEAQGLRQRLGIAEAG